MAEKVGAIYYTVEARTAALLDAEKDVSKSMNGMSSQMGKADKAAGKLNTQMTKTAVGVRQANAAAAGAQSAFGGLYKVLAAYIGLQGIKTLVGLSDEYGQMASRVKQVTADTAEYEKVQQRLLATANATYRPLAEAQEVFIRTADSIRDLGYNTDQALDITDSFSFLLVTNAASADRAKSAINAYSKSIQTGKVGSEQWQSILAAMPTVVDGIAAATGRSREEIKKLGVDGKLSLDALNEGLRRSRDENEALAAEMETSVQDAFTTLRNSLQVFVGKVNESSGSTGVLTAAVGDLAEILQDPATIAAAQDLAAGVVTALTSIISAAKDTVKVVKWAAESMSAAMHGASSDDIVRLDQQAEDLRKLQKSVSFNPLARVRLTGNGLEWFDDAEIAKRLAGTEALIAQFWKDQESRKTDLPSPVPTVAPEQVRLVEAEAAATEKSTKAKKERVVVDKEAAAAARELERAQSADLKTLADLSEALYQSTLSAEKLAVRKAELSLSSYATPEQIERVKELGKALFEAQELQRRSSKFGDTDRERDEYIRGNVSPLSGGMFDSQAARYEAEAQEELKRYQLQQERLTDALELQRITREEYAQHEAEFAQAHADRMAQIEAAKNQVLLASAEQGFGAMADIIKTAAGEQSTLYKAMFAASKAFAIAQALVSIQQGIAMAAANPWPVNLAAMANVAAATAGLVSNIASVTVGGRQYGGPVAAGSMYRINETGAPEVFNAANGRQYMLPNQRGEVVSNADASVSAAAPTQAQRPVKITQNISVQGAVDNHTLRQMEREAAKRQAIARARFG